MANKNKASKIVFIYIYRYSNIRANRLVLSWLCVKRRQSITNHTHYSDVTMSAMTSQITCVSIFWTPFVQAQIKENIKAPRRWPLWGELNRWPVNSPHTGPVTRNVYIWWRHHADPGIWIHTWQHVRRATGIENNVGASWQSVTFFIITMTS